jgi:PHD/YefM family antitoxin component YafN of YafNO toxin-antitoxin module|tara:strand:+ start:730 stop:936 length:207 start_codon:yes stop_codon:yes gene_type:complete
MIEVSLEDFEKNFDAYMERIETNKEEFLVRKQDGTAVVAVPAEQLEPLSEHMSDEEWYNLYSNHSEAS